jgi:hypothetical protein
MRDHCAFPSHSLRDHCAFASYSLRIRLLFASHSLRIRYVITAHSLRIRCAIAPLRIRLLFASHSLRNCWRMLQSQFPGHGIPYSYVAYYVRECSTCQKVRRTLSNDRQPTIIRHLKVPGPRSTIGIDGFTMTPANKHGNSYMHVIVNHFTKHVCLYPGKSKDAECALISYISMFGRFNSIISDPGSDYTSDIRSPQQILWL